jgi:hypothetical protein
VVERSWRHILVIFRQHRSGDGQLCVDMGSPGNPSPHRTVSQIAGERVVNCIRLRGLASHVPHRFSLPHRSAASCVLVTLARTIGQETRRGVALQLTNGELASAANVTPFTVSRLISDCDVTVS